MNKYERFCTELKEFCFKINITTPDLFKGETEENILQFEKKHNLKIPEGYRTVLKFTGESFLFYDNISLDINNSIGNIESCMRINSEKQFLKNVNKICSDLCNILPITYNHESSVMNFIRLDEENPFIYTYFGDNDDGVLDDDDLLQGSTWVNLIRRIIFIELKNKFYFVADPEEYIENQGFTDLRVKCVDIDNISWASKYTEAIKRGSKKKWHWYREEFENIATEIESREDRILGIDEFEWMFIDYLKEIGKL
jgi:hypothetical protein